MNTNHSATRLCLCLQVWILAVFAVAAVPATAQQGPRLDSLYAFGDSLSDSGNVFRLTRGLVALGLLPAPAVPPSISPNRSYFNGRFSNGPIVFEYLWRAMRNDDAAAVRLSIALPSLTGPSAVNFAFGGAQSGMVTTTPGGFPVPGFLGQVEAFRALLRGRTPRSQAAYALWVGPGDYLNFTPAPAPADPRVVVANISTGIQRLYALGARNFVVLNVPDLGLVPVIQALGPGVAQQFSQLTAAHNALLNGTLGQLGAVLPGARIVRIDVNGLLQTLPPIAPGPGLGIFGACLLLNPASCPDVPLNQGQPTIFWDVEHPTTFVHRALGQALFAALPR
jgi:phospholipase/lecithinase/hemolysin